MSLSISDFSMDFFRLDGKVALVTGGNTGLGQGYAVGLARAGADLFIAANDLQWDETRTLIEAEGRTVHFLQVDLSEQANIHKVVGQCMRVYGKIDILVNNAGIIKRAPLLEYPERDWQSVMDVNLNAVYYLSQETAKIMAEQGGGKIINICSMLSFQGGKFVPSYTASKHAVAGLTKAFANELASLNIQTNGVAPGYIATNATAQIRADQNRNQEIVSRIPADRWGDPLDVIGAVVFLAGRASDYINGHILAVDGGWLAR